MVDSMADVRKPKVGGAQLGASAELVKRRHGTERKIRTRVSDLRDADASCLDSGEVLGTTRQAVQATNGRVRV